jgi:hypothetical protein
MDILNFISWIAGKKRVVTTVPNDSLIPIGVPTSQRGDDYLTVAIKTSDFITQIGPGLVGPTGATGATGAQGPIGPQGVPGPVGPAGLNWQGIWSALTTYADNDAVSFGGASYFCYNPLGVGPSALDPTVDTANWALLASQGAIGPQGPQGIQGPPDFVHYIGEPYQGGIVVELWKDNLGVEHGLIMSYVNLASNVFSNVNVGGVLSASNGLANSNTIIGQAGHTTSMALDCLNYTNINYGTGVYTDWYLPAIGEMMCVVKNRVIIDNAIPVLGATGLLPAQYWTSTAAGTTTAMVGSQATLVIGSITKFNTQAGRPFRKF